MDFGIYVWLNLLAFLSLLGIFLFSFFLKIKFDRHTAWKQKASSKILPELTALIAGYSEDTYETDLADFLKLHLASFKTRRYYELMEELLYHLAEQGGRAAEAARDIGYKLGYPDLAIVYLKSKRTSRILHGCMAAGIYVYRPAVPYLLAILKRNISNQYDVLKAIAQFNDPKIVAEALTTIHNHFYVDERIVTDIVNGTSEDNRTQLFGLIMDIGSDHLSAMFIKRMDAQSASALCPRLTLLLQSDCSKELRIALLKAIAVTGQPLFIPELLYALQDPDWEIRSVAAKGLQMIPDERAFPALLKGITDSQWWVRQNSALALLTMPYPEHAFIMVYQLGDRYAIESLQYAAALMRIELPAWYRETDALTQLRRIS